MNAIVIVSWAAAGVVVACIYINKAYEAWKKKGREKQIHNKDCEDPQRKNEKAER